MGSKLEKGSKAVRKSIENHVFDDEEGDEYEGSKFGGFPEYFRRKKLKLQNLDSELRSSSADKPKIFKGIVAHVNGYTQPSLNDLHRLIVCHGGGFLQYLDGKTTVTHIIAASLTPKKAIEFRRYRIVKPAWIVDSVKAGKLLSWDSYRVLDEGVGQQQLGFHDGKFVSQLGTQQRGYRDQTNASWYTKEIRHVAEEIDNDEAAQFATTQPSGRHENRTYIRQEALKVPQAISTQTVLGSSLGSRPYLGVDADIESFKDTNGLMESRTRDGQSTSEQANGSFELSSSLENALATAADDLTSVNSLKRARSPGSNSPSKKPKKELTAEEHNALLLADPHIRNSSTANPDFIRQYYSESRLHHLSTWKADLKSQLQHMAAEKSLLQKGPQKRRPGTRRYVLHVDFDSFFCAVSLKTAPQYIDKPAVVAHGSGSGSEIASCNYPARTFGVKNGMWMKTALQLCSDLKVLPYNFPAYEEASRAFYKAIIDVGGIVQSVSVDEALLDVTALCLSAEGSDGYGISEGSIWREQEKAEEIARNLRKRINDDTGCAVSIGIGGNILLAKVALRKAKPAGQHQVKPEDVLEFIGDLTVQDLPGVAHSIGGKLEEIGVTFVKDVRSLTKERLMTILGPKTGEKIWDYSRGIDRTEVGEQVTRKSVSAEVNWGIRFISQPEAEDFVQNLCAELHRRLVEQRVKGRQLTMKIMRRAKDAPLDPPKNLGHGKCDVFNKSVVLGVATSSAEVIGREAISILRSYGFSAGELRGIGIQLTKLEPLKGSDSASDGSQKRISFKTTIPSIVAKESPGPSSAKIEAEDPIIDDIESPRKSRPVAVHPAAAIALANAADDRARKPLNVQGTQFILPTQVDPKVLSELPQDIRSKLLAQGLKPLPTTKHSRSVSPASVKDDFPRPLPSQLDPEVFSALPPEMQAEVLATYPARKLPQAPAQTVLPQSPRKNRTITTKKPITPTKRRNNILFRSNNKDSGSTLTQSNFVSTRPIKESIGTDSEAEEVPDDISKEFLDALPEDVRAEVLAQHRRERLARKGGLNLMDRAGSRKRRPANFTADLPPGQRRLRLTPQNPKPTFTTQNLSTLPELRETVGAWFREFKDVGPHSDDVAAMERYLRRVVLDERDLSKIVGVVNWLHWLVGESSEGGGKLSWLKALDSIKEKVQLAVKERGLGALEF
jgi:DNA repair protein REV1